MFNESIPDISTCSLKRSGSNGQLSCSLCHSDHLSWDELAFLEEHELAELLSLPPCRLSLKLLPRASSLLAWPVALYK